MSKKIISPIIVLTALLALIAIYFAVTYAKAFTRGKSIPPSPPYSTSLRVISPGDHLTLTSHHLPSSERALIDGTYKVDSKGEIKIPRIGFVKVGGKTPGLAERLIEHESMTKEVFKVPPVFFRITP